MNPQQQQQPVAMMTQCVPPTAFYVTSTDNVQMQPGIIAPTVGYVTMPMTTIPNPNIAETYQSRQSKALGITLIVIGVMAIILNIIGFAVGDVFAPSGHGFWSGFPFILTGSFGIAAATKRRCLIVTFMILSILVSSIIALPMLGLAVGGALSRVCYFYAFGECKAAGVIESLLAILAFVAAISSLWGSAICCRAVCCCASTYGTVITAPYGNQQVMIVSQQQQQPGAAQYYRPQVMPMTNFSPPAYPLGCVPPHQQFMAGPSSSSPQQQLCHQQQFSYGYASAPNADDIPPGVGLSVMNAPPAYSEIDLKGPITH